MNPEVRKTLLKLPGKLLYILFTLLSTQNQKFGVFLATGVKHTTDQGEQRRAEETPEGCL